MAIPNLNPDETPRTFHSEGAGEVRQENFTFDISSKILREAVPYDPKQFLPRRVPINNS
jgi:hypothetical protein